MKKLIGYGVIGLGAIIFVLCPTLVYRYYDELSKLDNIGWTILGAITGMVIYQIVKYLIYTGLKLIGRM